MKVFIDENLPAKLAEGLNILEQPNREGIEVLSIKTEFGKGEKDEDWIPKVGQVEGVVLTQDFNIHRKKSQFELYKKHAIGLFIFTSPSKKSGYSYWQLVMLLIENWDEIKKKAKSTTKPFAYIHKKRSGFSLLQ